MRIGARLMRTIERHGLRTAGARRRRPSARSASATTLGDVAGLGRLQMRGCRRCASSTAPRCLRVLRSARRHPLWRALVPVLVALAGVAAIVAGVILGGAVLAILAERRRLADRRRGGLTSRGT